MYSGFNSSGYPPLKAIEGRLQRRQYGGLLLSGILRHQYGRQPFRPDSLQELAARNGISERTLRTFAMTIRTFKFVAASPRASEHTGVAKRARLGSIECG